MSTQFNEPSERSEPASGMEAWLSSPIRLAFLALIAVILATLATSIGEIELRSAGGLDDRDRAVFGRQGVIWLLWAIVTPLLLGLAVRMHRLSSRWPLLVVAHLIIGALLGSFFLCVEIKLVEAGQSTGRTAAFDRWLNQDHDEQGPGRWGRGPTRGDGPGREASERDARRGEPNDNWPPPRDSEDEATADPRADDHGDSASDHDSRDRRADRGRGRGRGSSRRPPLPDRWIRQSAGFNVATGNLHADFNRRWPLRAPRYALVYISLMGIGLGIRAFLNGRQQERHAARLSADLTKARLETLKGQLHPHFLFNSLHSVGGLIRTSRGSDALEALASIGDLLRTSLDAEPEQFVPLERELELVQRYLAVEALRLGDRLEVKIDVPAELLPAEVPTFIAQPLMENAIKHAIANRASGGKVSLRAHQQGHEQLIIDIDDDGPGFHPQPGHVGVGIAHVKGRLEALFGDTASLELGSLPAGGTRARLTLPLDDLEHETAPHT